MIYVMSARMYWRYICDEDGKIQMTHNELIGYINRSFGLIGTVTELHIKKEG